MLEQVLRAVGSGYFEPLIDSGLPSDEQTDAAAAAMSEWAADAARRLVAISRRLDPSSDTEAA